MSYPTISVIIPCWREDLEQAINLVLCKKELADIEWIISMAVPPDDWKESTRKLEGRNAKVIHCETEGRGNQMNLGAEHASGQVLLFNHCDTILEQAHLDVL